MNTLRIDQQFRRYLFEKDTDKYYYLRIFWCQDHTHLAHKLRLGEMAAKVCSVQIGP